MAFTCCWTVSKQPLLTVGSTPVPVSRWQLTRCLRVLFQRTDLWGALWCLHGNSEICQTLLKNVNIFYFVSLSRNAILSMWILMCSDFKVGINRFYKTPKRLSAEYLHFQRNRYCITFLIIQQFKWSGSGNVYQILMNDRIVWTQFDHLPTITSDYSTYSV